MDINLLFMMLSIFSATDPQHAYYYLGTLYDT